MKNLDKQLPPSVFVNLRLVNIILGVAVTVCVLSYIVTYAIVNYKTTRQAGTLYEYLDNGTNQLITQLKGRRRSGGGKSKKIVSKDKISNKKKTTSNRRRRRRRSCR